MNEKKCLDCMTDISGTHNRQVRCEKCSARHKKAWRKKYMKEYIKEHPQKEYYQDWLEKNPDYMHDRLETYQEYEKRKYRLGSRTLYSKDKDDRLRIPKGPVNVNHQFPPNLDGASWWLNENGVPTDMLEFERNDALIDLDEEIESMPEDVEEPRTRKNIYKEWVSDGNDMFCESCKTRFSITNGKYGVIKCPKCGTVIGGEVL